MIFDIHAHCFKDSLAYNAIKSLSIKSQGILSNTDGTLKDTIRIMEEAKVSGFAVLNIAVTERQQKNVNDYAISINKNNVVAFGSVHPFSAEAISELNRLKENGIKGVKFHNEYQNFNIDDEKAFTVYEHCFKLGFAVLFHGGVDLGFDTPLKASPERARNVAKTFPKYKFIMAHFGGYGVIEDAIKYLADTQVELDSSFPAKLTTVEKANRAIKAFGSKRIYFGSDCPWVSPIDAVAFINKLNLTEEEKKDIFFKNAEKLLNLSIINGVEKGN